jgi:hypothetical protein
VTLLSDEKPLEGKLEGLSQVASIFEIEGINLDTFVLQSEVNKLSEKIGKTVTVTTIGFTVVETGASAALMVAPEKNKCLLIASGKDYAKIFVDAFEALKVKKAE